MNCIVSGPRRLLKSMDPEGVLVIKVLSVDVHPASISNAETVKMFINSLNNIDPLRVSINDVIALGKSLYFPK